MSKHAKNVLAIYMAVMAGVAIQEPNDARYVYWEHISRTQPERVWNWLQAQA